LGWSWTWCNTSERIHQELWWRSTLSEGTGRRPGDGCSLLAASRAYQSLGGGAGGATTDNDGY
jgi:hypothetical protein